MPTHISTVVNNMWAVLGTHRTQSQPFYLQKAIIYINIHVNSFYDKRKCLLIKPKNWTKKPTQLDTFLQSSPNRAV